MNPEYYVPKPEASDSESTGKRPKMTLLGLGRTALIFFAIFASILIWSVASYAWDMSRATWPTTNGRITSVNKLPGLDEMSPCLRVYYEYRIGTQTYEGQTYFAPGPDPGAASSYIAGTETYVHYNTLIPSLSTIAPDSQSKLQLAYIVLAGLAVTLTLLGRPDLSTGKEMRAQLPNFLDCLATLIESGVSIPAAMERAAEKCSESCPTLSKQIKKCILSFKINRTPLHQSLAQAAATYQVIELNYLATSLAAVEKSGGR